MNIRAGIFDVYGTLLSVAPPPADAEERWQQLHAATFHTPAPITLPAFGGACERVVIREHDAARALGIHFPEVCWPAVVAEVLPQLGALPPADRAEFLFQQAQIWHTVRLMEGAVAVLRSLRRRGVLLGIASNAQAYTTRELERELGAAGLSLELFDPVLRFWSFEYGFSKPEPHVGRLLGARLTAKGIQPGEVLMVGDQLGNDIAPARLQGWQTWQLSPTAGERAGAWQDLARWLADGPA